MPAKNGPPRKMEEGLQSWPSGRRAGSFREEQGAPSTLKSHASICLGRVPGGEAAARQKVANSVTSVSSLCSRHRVKLGLDACAAQLRLSFLLSSGSLLVANSVPQLEMTAA